MQNQSQIPKETLKDKLAKNYWNKKVYVDTSIQFSLDTKNSFWMKILKEKSKTAQKILDVGCSEGSRLNQLNKKSQLFGLDYSKNAIKVGQKKYKNIKLISGDAEKMPFPDSYFDLVYTAYTIEHLTNPEKVIAEMTRVTKKGGSIAFIGPNFGSPLIPAPILKGPRMLKIFRVVVIEIKHLLGLNNGQLEWKKVKPLISTKFTPDDDCVNQPYLPSLIWTIEKGGLKTSFASSGWEDAVMAHTLSKIIFAVFKISRILNFYPFKYWGPTIFLVCNK